jgi:ribosomal protein S18 acetylase RimI-like enzyme
MDIRIRRGRRTDYAALAALGGWPEGEAPPTHAMRRFRRIVADLAYDLYVAEDDGSAVGMVAVSYVRSLPLGGQRATLEELVVRTDRRRSGIGRRLLEFVIRRASRRGVRAFEARPADDESARFLDRLGFRPSGIRYSRPLEQGPNP